MRFDVKRKLFIIGISFVAALLVIYYFINYGYIDYKLNKTINEKYLSLETKVVDKIKIELDAINEVEIGKKEDEIYKNDYVIYKLEENNPQMVNGDLFMDKEIINKIIEKNNDNIGVLIFKENLLGVSKKKYKDEYYLLIKKIYSIDNEENIVFENLNYNLDNLDSYNKINVDSNLVNMNILKHKNNENLDTLLILESNFTEEGYIGLKINSRAITNVVIKDVILGLLFIYGIVMIIFGRLFFKTMNKEFFFKIQHLENRIKESLDEPEKPNEIIKELNIDSIEYIENNITNIISSVNEYKEIVNYYVKYDSLTSLINRETFIKDGNIQVENGKALALIYINLDGFSYYNNNFGYVKGDEILREISRIILKSTGNHNMVARIGGDEFAILIQEEEKFKNIQNYVETLLSEINSVKLYEKGSFVSASIGISIKGENEKNIVELINNAYLAMVSVKEKRKNSYEFFNVSHKKEITIEMIQRALEQEDIQIHYQPKVNMKTNEIDGVEALVRWFDKEKGYISPLDFIKVAEDTGYIIAFGDWIFRNAVRDIKKMNEELEKEISVAINVSSIQFMQRNFVDKIERILIEEDMSPKNVEIELTESIGIFNSNHVMSTFSRLSELGVSIAIDDFGTGYSSIKYLKEFKINTIKIDKTFVQGGGKNISIIKYIIDVCKILGFAVVAEGVEEYRQARMLKNLSCDYIQGYFFYKPMSIQKLYEAIENDETVIIN